MIYLLRSRFFTEKNIKPYIFLLFVFLIPVILQAKIIKKGDVIDIYVKGNDEFSGLYKVNEEGTIDYPLFADEYIVNYTTSELMNDLTIRLAKHIDNPLVLIRISEKTEMTVTVLGQISNPGPVKTYKGVTIQEIIKQAGGPVNNADVSKIKIIPKGGGEAEAIYFDLKKFLKKGDLDNIPRLKPEDTIILLTEERASKVKVIGGVNKPGFYTLEDSLNLFEIIYLAGGPVEKADLSEIRRFFKGEDGKTIEETVDLQGYIDRGEMDKIPQVSEGDVIIIYTKWFDWKTMLTILNNVLLFILTIQNLKGALGD